jgi:sugar phosphate isomerase/epimerase
MIEIVLNSIALEPNRWTSDKIAHFRLQQLLKPVAESEFRFMELWQYHISREDPAHIESIRQLAEESGLTFPIVGMYPILHLSDAERDRELDATKKMMDYAATLGARVIKIFVGNQSPSDLTPHDYDASVEFMTLFTELAASHDLVVTGETHKKTLFETVESCLRFITDVGAANLKICFQPLDLVDTERTISDFRALATDVVHIHCQGRRDQSFALLEESDLDYRRFVRAVVESGFEGYVCIEFVKDCVVEQGVEFPLMAVIGNARKDREFLIAVAKKVLPDCSIVH